MSKTSATYQHQAYNYIKGQIMNLGLKPGEWITDTQIAGQLNISRTPVREAFYRLEKEGLLINEARRGWKIYTLSLENIHDIFDLKEAVEGMVARKAAECQDESLRAALREALTQMETASIANDPEAWLESDVHLHDVLFMMSGNERARHIVTDLNAQWHRVRIGFVALQGRTRRSADEHRAFIECILNGNGEEAERQMRTHLNRVRDELVHLLVTMVLPFVSEGV
jgi:DNA-binding GntR family transcriptional regulator